MTERRSLTSLARKVMKEATAPKTGKPKPAAIPKEKTPDTFDHRFLWRQLKLAETKDKLAACTGKNLRKDLIALFKGVYRSSSALTKLATNMHLINKGDRTKMIDFYTRNRDRLETRKTRTKYTPKPHPLFTGFNDRLLPLPRSTYDTIQFNRDDRDYRRKQLEEHPAKVEKLMERERQREGEYITQIQQASENIQHALDDVKEKIRTKCLTT